MNDVETSSPVGRQSGTALRRLKSIALVLLTLFMLLGESMHFANPGFYLKIMPDSHDLTADAASK